MNPLSSYQYRDVGVNIDMTPTVTLDGDIRLDLTLENSPQGADTNVGGVAVPSFVQRKVTHAAAPARRRVEPAGRPAADQGRAKGVSRISRR